MQIMKKWFILRISFVVFLFIMVSCFRNRTREVSALSTNDTLSNVIYVEQDIRIIENETVTVDTTINTCSIRYIIRDNNELAGYENGYRFKCREVTLIIAREGVRFEYLINRDLFEKWISSDDMSKVSVQSFEFVGVEGSGALLFETMLCIPDTDEGYLFSVSILNQDVVITEIPIQWVE